MAVSHAWERIDERLGGSLDQRLRTWAHARVPAEAIRRLLIDATGVHVSGETVRRWVRQINGEAA